MKKYGRPYLITECFPFLVFTKWSNPVIHINSSTREATSSSTTVRYLDWNSSFVSSSKEDQQMDGMCGLWPCYENPSNWFPSAPLYALRVGGEICALLKNGAGSGRYFTFSSRAYDYLDFLHHGSRLLGWWSIDEGSHEEQARLFQEGAYGLSVWFLTGYMGDSCSFDQNAQLLLPNEVGGADWRSSQLKLLTSWQRLLKLMSNCCSRICVLVVIECYWFIQFGQIEVTIAVKVVMAIKLKDINTREIKSPEHVPETSASFDGNSDQNRGKKLGMFFIEYDNRRMAFGRG
ncbi:hypothetical protein HS088_TW20G00488 [Tripterygium wilfordii]|uniref:Uncharacterized protein n=1 Tax=Tripterygium wilfordii TaxID=458696 RepID=A0A7J7C7K1_TRIWF|nr:hypothetical protein HS088_TW20G00488 [Tripterygium wilfordii]